MATVSVERTGGPPGGVHSQQALNVLVFCAGAGALATEIAAARLLAPYYGSSTIVWANVIGLVLAFLSLGYWLGGRVVDRHPSFRVLGRIVLGAGVLIALVPFAAGLPLTSGTTSHVVEPMSMSSAAPR